jgi:TRAP-type transport system small permease protein
MQDVTAEGTEQPDPPIESSNKVVRIIRTVVASIAATSLALLMFLMAFDVAGRYILNRPIVGSYELIEYLMAFLVPLGVAYCAAQKNHIGVDIVVERLSRKTRRRVDTVMLLIATILCGILTWQTIIAIPESYASGLKSAVLHIPAYPSVAAVAVGAAGLTLFTLIHFIETLKELFSK